MLLKFIILIPHLITLWVLGIIGCFASWFAFWAVLFTGKYPRSLFNFIAGFLKWQVKVNAWFYSLTDKYPPFSLH